MNRLEISSNSKASLARNKKVVASLSLLLGDKAVPEKIPKAQSNLIVSLATVFPKSDFAKEHIGYVRDLILTQKISRPEQLQAAVSYFEDNFTFEEAEFSKKCGIGVTISTKEIEKAVRKVIDSRRDVLSQQKWEVFPRMRPQMMKELSEAIPFADGKKRTEIFNEQIKALIGAQGKREKKSKKKPAENHQNDEPVSLKRYLNGRKLSIVYNSEDLYKAHLKRTKGVFRSRFPPEPNGFLHIGHAKAINFNFGLAKEKNGDCFLRFDDTNPLSEKQIFIDSIIDNVDWLGFKPAKVTYSSDCFEQLYDLAVRMIERGFAYVCHETQAEIKASREIRKQTGVAQPSIYRDRSVAENLELFEKMKNGHFKPGEATLRMKGDLQHANPNMWDHVAYRIIDAPHPHVGDKWRIYPSYDFTHCVVDSLEDIDASCCTLEFENRRESYFWLLDVLGLYKPVVWEFSRLNMQYNVMSKRILSTLVSERIVRDWDDPRLLTINGIRRKGIPAQAVNDFCEKIGVTRADNSIAPSFFNACARTALDKTAFRSMCVLEPLKVVLTNFGDDQVELIKCPLFPHLKRDPENDSGDFYSEELRKILFIERSDFKNEDSKKFYGLAPGKSVRLKYAFNITCNSIVRDKTGGIDHVLCTADFTNEGPTPKGVLHWVSDGAALFDVEVRLYEDLFTTEKPGSSWREEINPNSLVVVQTAKMNRFAQKRASEWEKKPWECNFQFERVGYFCLDEDSEPAKNKLVFNRTLPLKESKEKRK